MYICVCVCVCVCVLLVYIIYYIKLKSPVRPQFLVAWISAVDARIDVELTREEAANFWGDQVYFKEFLTATE